MRFFFLLLVLMKYFERCNICALNESIFLISRFEYVKANIITKRRQNKNVYKINVFTFNFV